MFKRVAAALSLATAMPVMAQGPAPAPASTAPATPPKLIVAISVDQFSADLFSEYRQ